jgi:hypothetical protein
MTIRPGQLDDLAVYAARAKEIAGLLEQSGVHVFSFEIEMGMGGLAHAKFDLDIGPPKPGEDTAQLSLGF